MPGANFDVRIGLVLPAPLPQSPAVNATTFPALAASVQAVAEFAQAQWRAYLSGAPLPDGRKITPRSGASARSVQVSHVSDFARMVSSESPVVDALEQGTAERDMKRMLQTSSKVRISAKTGKRYLIIPFRHGTPGTVGFASVMPQHIHAIASAFAASRVTGQRSEPSQVGLHDINTRNPVMVMRRNYSWGDRLPAGLVSKTSERHHTDRFAGMVRFDSPKGGHSSYLTFRVMTEGSTGWIRAAMPGYWPARTTAQQVEAKANAIFADAFAHDLRSYLPL